MSDDLKEELELLRRKVWVRSEKVSGSLVRRLQSVARGMSDEEGVIIDCLAGVLEAVSKARSKEWPPEEKQRKTQSRKVDDNEKNF